MSTKAFRWFSSTSSICAKAARSRSTYSTVNAKSLSCASAARTSLATAFLASRNLGFPCVVPLPYNRVVNVATRPSMLRNFTTNSSFTTWKGSPPADAMSGTDASGSLDIDARPRGRWASSNTGGCFGRLTQLLALGSRGAAVDGWL